MNNIRKRRLELGLTQQQLCEQAGLSSASHVSSFELGKSTPYVPAAIRIARALNTTVEELFTTNQGEY